MCCGSHLELLGYEYSFFLDLFLIMCVGISFCICSYVEVPAEARGSGSSETGIMVDYELPDMGAGNRTWVHWKCSKPF